VLRRLSRRILLAMQIDPVSEWQRLTEHYRQMSDDELRDLAFDIADLTESAQQVLRSEMRSRGMGDPQTAGHAPKISNFSRSGRSDPDGSASPTRSACANATTASAEDLVSRDRIRRLPLCQCDDWKQAWQICEALRANAIESWIQDARADIEDSLVYAPEMGPPSALFSPRAFRVLVAADRLAEAREIAAQPIPREIVDASERSVPEFTPPRCPGCGGRDPVLIGVEPENSWRCEQCGKEWSDALLSTNPEVTGGG
jgi:hypothetical protein